MPEYIAPVKELAFVLDTVAGLPDLAKRDAYAEATPELTHTVLDEAAKLASDVFAPLNVVGDTNGVTLDDAGVHAAPGFVDAYASYQESGWLSLAIPEAHGGQGLPFALHIAVSEMWNSANLSFALCPMLSMGAIEALIAHGNPVLNEQYLAGLVAATVTGTMNLTEPQAGSDLAAVKTIAVPDGDAYRLTGQKIYITWGDHDLTDNIVHMVLARTPDAPAGVRGLSLFLVPKLLTNGDVNDLRALSVEHKLGIHASPTCVMSFGDSGQGSLGYLVGELNQGLACMFTMMNHARLEVGLEGVGVGERALQAARTYANDRRQGSAAGHDGQVPIVEHPDVRRMLLTMRALTEAGRALVAYSAGALDRAHAPVSVDEAAAEKHRLELLTPVVKAWCTEVVQEVASLGVQVHGGMGYVEETGAAQFLRDARITPIYEGTNGIQAADFIGRKFLRDDGAALNALFADVDATIATVRVGTDADAAARLKVALDEARQAADLVRAGADDPSVSHAQAWDFLMLNGYLVGGWLYLKQLIALDGYDTDDEFRAAKRLSAMHYLGSLLPRVHLHSAAIRSAHIVAMADSAAV
ncbi:MAG: acyl-CoA dehydrogenase [Pseudomonadota bacterium]